MILLDLGLVLKVTDSDARFVIEPERDVARVGFIHERLAIDLPPAGFACRRRAGIDLGERLAQGGTQTRDVFAVLAERHGVQHAGGGVLLTATLLRALPAHGLWQLASLPGRS